MSLASRLTRCPLIFDPAPAGAVHARFGGQPAGIMALLEGTAGCSPFLAGLIAQNADWLEMALAGTAEAALDDALAIAPDLAPEALGRALRQAKARVALWVALADLGGVWLLEVVTGALTRLADLAVDRATRALVAEEARRGRLPEGDAGMVVLAMGKMGAGELNYSSDIDLICLFDDSLYDGADVQEARSALIRVTRKMAAMLSDRSAEGYVFRTDLRLRPDASVTPVCISMTAAEQYYEAQGRTWERAAYIKARPCAGDLAAGARFLSALTPFVWRRHLDFAAIQDAHDMRLRIREHKGLRGPILLEGHNMKLGQGGIREIEFFTQTRQLIAGGRDPSLRDRTTLGGLAALAAANWVPCEVAEELGDHYRAHREVEHRLQMVHDAQTHVLPRAPEEFDRLARMMGEADTQRMRTRLVGRLERVAELTEDFFAPGEVAPAPTLSAEAQSVVDGWRSYPALRSERAVTIFKRVQPGILARLDRAASPAEALRQFDGFLAGLPAGVQLFSLFEANPQLIELIVDVCATAPGLAAYLSRNARVLDAVIGGAFFSGWPGAAALQGELAEKMAALPDYERKLDAARAWAKEWHFRVGVHHLRGLIDAAEAGRQYADLAGACVGAVWEPCQAEFARKHGPAPGRGAVVLGMGSLGAERLNAASDLDLIVIYDAPNDVLSDGPRPLAGRAYYARLTQALITALSAPMAEGRLYEVDMRLRPSGRQGPVATSLGSFRDYQMTEAWTWEHLALTRARPVAGDPDLAADVEVLRREVLAEKGATTQDRTAVILGDVRDMRARIFAAKLPDGDWEAKIGRGRLQDIELLAQSFALRMADPSRRVEAQLRAGARGRLISKEAEAVLQAAYRFYWRLQAGGRLLSDRPLDMAAVGEGGRAFLLRETGTASLPELAERLGATVAEVETIVARCLEES